MVNIRLRQRLYLLPIITAGFCTLSFIITYVVAATLGHVELAFPYISYTGLENPERGIFGQLLNIGALLLGLNAYFRYLRLQYAKSTPVKLNIASLVLGLFSAFGISMVANFETKVMRAPHYVGAFLGFGIAGVYCWLQTVITWKRRRDPDSRPRLTFLYQLIVSCLLTFWAIVFIVSKIVYKSYDNEEERREYPGPVRTAYLVSTSAEWCLAISLMSFLLSFITDFRNVEIRGPVIIVAGEKKTVLLGDTNGRFAEAGDHSHASPGNRDVNNVAVPVVRVTENTDLATENADLAGCSLIVETEAKDPSPS